MTKKIGHLTFEELLNMEIKLLTKLQSGVLSVHSFEMYLKGRCPFDFPNTIKLGTFNTKSDMFGAIKEVCDYDVLDSVKDIIFNQAFMLVDSEIDFQTVILTGAGLGFKEAETSKKIYERAISQGFGNVCPAEVGPQLRLQYLGQPKNEMLFIAMEPITISDGNSYILGLRNGNDGILRLNNYSDNADRKWDPRHEWVFQRQVQRLSPLNL